jgi:hypothetical protein
MRSFRVTGTMAASVSRTENDLSAPTDDEKAILMTKFIKSWYGRFKATSAMKEGTVNEEPTADAFSLEPMVVELYEIGLLQCIAKENTDASKPGMQTCNCTPGIREQAQP